MASEQKVKKATLTSNDNRSKEEVIIYLGDPTFSYYLGCDPIFAASTKKIYTSRRMCYRFPSTMNKDYIYINMPYIKCTFCDTPVFFFLHLPGFVFENKPKQGP